jgi:hypothetical protein
LARELRDDCQVKLARGLDPIEARNKATLAARAERAKQMTFRQCADDYFAVNASKLRNEVHGVTPYTVGQARPDQLCRDWHVRRLKLPGHILAWNSDRWIRAPLLRSNIPWLRLRAAAMVA